MRIITKNTAMGTGGSFIEKSYSDILNDFEKNNVKPKEKQKSADEIVSDVIARGGLQLINNEREEELE